MIEVVITRGEFARRIGVSTKTLENWEAKNYGPMPVRLGRLVRYRETEVAEWVRNLSNAAS